MRSPFSPVLANIFMQYFEELLNSFPLKPKLWIRYMHGIFIIWSHRIHNLNNYLNHNNQLFETYLIALYYYLETNLT